MVGTGKRLLAGLALALGVGLAGWAALPGAAQKGGAKGPALPEDLARAPAKGMMFVSVRPADLWTSPLGKGMRDRMGKDVTFLTEAVKKEVGLELADVERLTLVVPTPGAMGPLVLIRTARKADRKAILAAAVPGAEAEKYGQGELHVGRQQALTFLGDQAYAVGDKEALKALWDRAPGKETGGLVPGYALAAGKHSLVAAVNPEAFPPLPDETPAELEPYLPLLKAGLGTVAVDVGEKTTGRLRVTFPTEKEAQAGLKGAEAGRKEAVAFLKGLMTQLKDDKTAKGLVGFLKLAEAGLAKAKVERQGTVLTAAADLTIDTRVAGEVGADAVVRMRRAAMRMQGSNNLKQIALALHNYHSAIEAFPAAAIYDQNGKPLLSWRVLILPYIDQDALYREFKLNEPWDSKHNKKLLEKMPRVYQAPGAKTKNKYGTVYQVFAGKGTMFEGKTGIKIEDILDGTSNTIMVAESAADVPWTKPEDMPFDAKKELPKLGGVTPGGFQAAFGDGSVRFIRDTLKKDTLKAMITRSGGEVIGVEDR